MVSISYVRGHLTRERRSRRALSPTGTRTLEPILLFVCTMPHLPGDVLTPETVGWGRASG